MNNDNTPRSDQDKLVNTVTQQLHKQAAELDPAVTAKLDAARRQALAQCNTEHSRQHDHTTNQRWWTFSHAPAIAATLVVAVLIGVVYNSKQSPTNKNLLVQSLDSSFEVVLTNNDFELMEEDLEFYLWLEEMAETG